MISAAVIRRKGRKLDTLIAPFFEPAGLAALSALIVMEIVLGIDNLIFISILTNKLPEKQRPGARRMGIGLAVIMRLLLLASVAWLVGLTTTVIDFGLSGSTGEYGQPTFETAFSWRDIILIFGGLFLVWKATTEIHQSIDPEPASTVFAVEKVGMSFTTAIVQIILLDMVFSIDSILTAIGMTDHIPIMVVAVLVSVVVMVIAATPLANFIHHNPTVVMLALSFLLMIGMVLIADGFGVHVPKGYLYAAMAFSIFVEALNMLARRRPLFPQSENKES